ncbi:MAG TPA: L-rhamnose/proton symporter RhaT [Lacipirellulaceae bacterium]|nr:L-rhamnose/proton symporter RhaT [Lacipirellulaceae bacterium]
MTPNPAVGILLHAIGGFAAGTFYSPIKKVKSWSWETAWLVMGLAAWLACPWIAAYLTTPKLGAIIGEGLQTQQHAILLTIMFGFLWGFGNLTYGMAARYLGIALGGSVALGFCMLFGTVMPPIFAGEASKFWADSSGLMISLGLGLGLFGIALCGEAGRRRDLETSKLASDAAGEIERFDFRKGIMVAVIAGILSACFSFGLEGTGKPLAAISAAKGTDPLYKNNVVLIAVLTGGFLSNALICLWMNARNRTFGDYTRFDGRYLRNLALAWLAGVTWFFQFFFYGMGSAKLGDSYAFASWTIHMAFIVVFLNMWGLIFREWRGTSSKTQSFVWAGILILIGSTVVIGWGNKIAAPPSPGEAPAAAESNQSA